MKTTDFDLPPWRSIALVLPKLSENGNDDFTVFVGPVAIDGAINAWSDLTVAPGAEWILDWLKNEGDIVAAGEPVADLRGLVGSIPVETPVDGVLTEIRVKEGGVGPGDVLAIVSAPCSTADVEILDTNDEDLARYGNLAPTVKLVNTILISAREKGASHVYVEPTERQLWVRFRVDGILYDVVSPPLKMRDAITARLKAMASLDTAQDRVSQHGRIYVHLRNRGVRNDKEIHVSCKPTAFGQSVRLSLMDSHDAE